ncbi:hypothetical protein CDD83_6791 [Cordyceps sp. RAO-2017]|nr:hypothetical protein CDD83_6791 [Cordyceps sp. RAO-2017]
MAGFASFHSPPLALPQCGCFTIVGDQRKCLPLLDVHVHTSILSSASRTTLRQAFVNPDAQAQLGEVRYDFPLYDGVSVVGFKCSIGRRVITGVIKERQEAKKAYESAINEGKVAALLNQDIRAADVFTAALGNVPAGARVEVEITYLGELEHDAEADCLRLTIPTSVAPRYDRTQVLTWAAHDAAGGVAQEVGNMSITVDVQMARECPIANIQSPSHPISVGIGKTSAVSASADEPSSPQRASVSLALEAAQLDKDFVLMVAAAGLTSPVALVEAHPTIPHQQAVMATLVPRFNLPAGKPEIVFVCDRSGSMGMGQKIPNLVAALQIFLKSLPVGVRFNICSFGSQHKFLWQKSQAYNQETLDKAVEHVQSFAANFGGTEMYQPLVDTFNRRSAETNLEVFLLTDGEVWEQTELFQVVDDHVGKSNGAIRIFTLGVGDQASSALVKGVARAGNGFAQMVSDHERMDKKIIRMLKGALTPHIKDYALGITYEGPGSDDGVASRREDLDDDFEIVGDALRGLSINTEKGSGEKRENQAEPQGSDRRKEPISLFDPNVQDEDLEMTCASDGIINESGCLPDIELPRYLQTPYKVPALFPFSRTTVYVLLSDSKSNRQLKSVVLTGTSDQGPLRLEIPVTKTVEKGSTLHQLAARKAMQELEDDRGWPTQARDGDGKLLSKEFPGHTANDVEGFEGVFNIHGYEFWRHGYWL